jgi:hypothetical protein
MRQIDDYNINPKIRELILQRKADASKFTNVQAENVVNNALKSEFIEGGKKYNEAELYLIKRIILELNPNDYYKESLKNLSGFIKYQFTVDEYTSMIQKMVKRWYKPGMVVNLLHVHNSEIIYLASLFETIIFKHGIISNITFIGDIGRFFEGLKVNEDTGEIIEDNLKEKFENLLKELKVEFTDISIKIIDDVYFMYSDNKDSIETISKRFNVECDDIPEFYLKMHNVSDL